MAGARFPSSHVQPVAFMPNRRHHTINATWNGVFSGKSYCMISIQLGNGTWWEGVYQGNGSIGASHCQSNWPQQKRIPEIPGILLKTSKF